MPNTERARFDADCSPEHQSNRKAANEHGLRYDPSVQMYVDAEGALVRDKFGQRL